MKTQNMEMIQSAVELMQQFEEKRNSMRTVAQILAPKGVRKLFRHGFSDDKMEDDTLDYIERVTNVLNLLKRLSFLRVPYNLTYSHSES